MNEQRSWWWTVLGAMVAAGMLSALGGTWEAPPGAPPLATPRGTAPLPPRLTPSPSLAATTPQTPGPSAPTAATPTIVGAPVGIAPAAPTATPMPTPPPPEAAASTPPSVAPATATAATTRPASPSPALPGGVATAAATAAIMPTASPTASGLIALEATPVFPAVLAPNSEVMVQPDAAAVLTSSDRRVTVAVAAGVAHQPVRLSYTAASYTASQRQTAQRQGLLLTNLGFTLATAPATPLMAEITVRYSAAQISGIAEPSLTLFQRRTADGGWDPLPDCRVEPSERRVVCRAVANGDFLLAGTSGETLDTAVPPAPAPAAQWGGGAATLWGVLAAAGAVFLGGGAFLVWRARRVQP